MPWTMTTFVRQHAITLSSARFFLVAIIFLSSFVDIISMSKTKARVVVEALSTSTSRPLRVLAYGDSLTAGTSPPLFEEFPYAPHLEQTLRNDYSMDRVVVRHRGLPGWTAAQMVDNMDSPQVGLRTAVRAVSDPPLSLVLLLAGTNDLGYETRAQTILDSLFALHDVCHKEGVQTLAIGIPSSGYQNMVPDAAELANELNKGLSDYCESSSDATFVQFPFGFEPGDDKWAPDGLHFSQLGYQVLGTNLAPTVSSLLSVATEKSPRSSE